VEIWFESINIDKKSALEPKQINGAWLEQIWTKNRKIETWFQSKIQKAKSLFSWPTSCPKPLPYKYTSNSDLKNTILQLKKPHTNIKKPWKKSQVQTRFQIDSSQTKDSSTFLEAFQILTIHQSIVNHLLYITVCTSLFEIEFTNSCIINGFWLYILVRIDLCKLSGLFNWRLVAGLKNHHC